MKTKLNIFCYFCLSFIFVLICCIVSFCFVLFLFCVLELINPILGIQNVDIVLPLSILSGILCASIAVMVNELLHSKQFQ